MVGRTVRSGGQTVPKSPRMFLFCSDISCHIFTDISNNTVISVKNCSFHFGAGCCISMHSLSVCLQNMFVLMCGREQNAVFSRVPLDELFTFEPACKTRTSSQHEGFCEELFCAAHKTV